MFRKARSCACLGFAGALLSIAGAVSAQTYDAAKDFSIASNPNGVWQYGFTNTNILGSRFIRDTRTFTFGPLEAWAGDRAADGNPSISYNTSNTEFVSTTVRWQPGQMILHPGPGGEYSVLRWTAPNAGILNIQTAFIGQDVGGTTTDVHVVHNDVSLFDGVVNGYLNGTSFTGSIRVAANDTLDIAVGYGNGHTFSNDATGVKARFALVPAPGACLTALIGILPGMSVLIRRRHAAKSA